jgi:hypothetical protein
VTGETAIYIRKHDCSSEEDGCWLSPGQPLKEFVGEPRQLEFYFPFRTHASFDNLAQSFEVEAVSRDTAHVSLSSIRRGKLVDGRAGKRYLGRYSEGNNDTYMLHVRRAPSPSASPISVAWRTNLTYLFGARGGYPSTTPGGPAPLSLYCVDETGGDTLGNDEVLLEVGSGVGAARKVHFRAFWPDVNAGDPMMFADMPPLPLVGPAKIWISELTTEVMSTSLSDRDETVELTIPPLDWNVPERLAQLRTTSLHPVAPDGSVNPYNFFGEYEVTFNQAHSLSGEEP